MFFLHPTLTFTSSSSNYPSQVCHLFPARILNDKTAFRIFSCCLNVSYFSFISAQRFTKSGLLLLITNGEMDACKNEWVIPFPSSLPGTQATLLACPQGLAIAYIITCRNQVPGVCQQKDPLLPLLSLSLTVPASVSFIPTPSLSVLGSPFLPPCPLMAPSFTASTPSPRPPLPAPNKLPYISSVVWHVIPWGYSFTWTHLGTPLLHHYRS